MASENFNELMRLIMGPCFGRITVVKQLLDNLDVIAEDERKIAGLYLMLSPDEQATVKQIVNIVADANQTQTPPPISVAPGSSVKPLERPLRHPPVKSWPNGELLADTIHSFAMYHKPQLKYTGMHTAIDVLTACRSPEGDWYDFHYEIKTYKPNDGVYIQRVSGRGHRTSAADTDKMERGYC